ncbi:MAG TPA: hypothetical protein VHV30_12370, partial [Polyangiaceae bacterium]|nr:hypothetical protein [Polyangiaceae bacterium]
EAPEASSGGEARAAPAAILPSAAIAAPVREAPAEVPAPDVSVSRKRQPPAPHAARPELDDVGDPFSAKP